MKLFSRKKKPNKKTKSNKIDAAFSRVYTKIDSMDSWEDPKKLEQYILDSCEQIIASTKEMEKRKREYRIVTSYLNDIKLMDELPADADQELRNAAAKIKELEASIEAAQHIHRNITDEQRYTIAEDEDDMPGIINRMKADEIYQAKVKQEMYSLEGDKSRWEIERENLQYRATLLKRAAAIMFTSFTAILILFVVMSNATKSDVTLPMLIVFFICAIAGMAIYLRQNDIKKKSREAVIRLNQAISLLNVQRMKYVNVTNGIEYQKDKYDVRSAAELEYVWEQYMEVLRDREHYAKAHEDLEFYSVKLEKIIHSLGLHDAEFWLGQTNAIINRDDMVEVRHKLVARRQKIRDRIEDHKRIVQNERDEIDRLMISHQHYLPEIQEIIKSVDKLCGTKSRVAVSN